MQYRSLVSATSFTSLVIHIVSFLRYLQLLPLHRPGNLFSVFLDFRAYFPSMSYSSGAKNNPTYKTQAGIATSSFSIIIVELQQLFVKPSLFLCSFCFYFVTISFTGKKNVIVRRYIVYLEKMQN